MKTPRRGYALVFVLVFGVILATLSAVLLIAASRDRDEGRLQADAVRSLYAAEAAVAVGTGLVAEALKTTPTPDVTSLTATALSQLATAAPGATFPAFSIKYILDKDTGATSTTPPSPAPAPTALTSGTYRGLFASQMPIQVLASASVKKGRATLADAIQVNLIPIFQFAVFMDGPIEYYFSEPSTVSGRLHSNTGIFFADGADDLTLVNPMLTTAGRVHLRAIDQSSSQTSGRAPLLDTDNDGTGDTNLPCDDAPSSAVGCPSGASWLNFTTTNLPFIRDQAHGAERLSLPTGVDAADFNVRTIGVPDTCGLNADNSFNTSSGIGAPVSPDWQVIDLPRAADTSALKNVKYAHLAGVRVVDGAWFLRAANGSYTSWFSQSDPTTAEAKCVYYGYDPSTDAALTSSDGVPAIQDIRFWDFQDRQMRRALLVDVHRLTRCLPFLDTSSFNGILYFGETLNAAVDNWGLDPDARFYATDATGNCDANFVKLPHYLRGQMSTSYGLQALAPAYLANDDVALAEPRLDNPYYPVDGFCAPKTGRTTGLGDGPLRLPQGNGNGTREPGRNELVETAVVLRNAQRVPNVANGTLQRGFSFATNAPVYLQGDINTQRGTFSATRTGYTAGKVPTAIAADAMTFVSDKFNFLLMNPFAPVGPLAGIKAFSSAGNAQRAVGSSNRTWGSLDIARSSPAGTPADFEFNSGKPASPAPCTNLLRELLLRVHLSNTESDSADDPPGFTTTTACGANASDDCGHGTIFDLRANAGASTLAFGYGSATAVDWSRDLRPAASAKHLCNDVDRNGCSTAEFLVARAPEDGATDKIAVRDYLRASNAFVAFAPLEAFLDTGMFADKFSSGTAGFSSRNTPTRRNDREAVRDWMRCTLNSRHPLADIDDLDSIKVSGALLPAVLVPSTLLQPGAQTTATDAAVNGMKSGSTDFDVTYAALLGSNGFAPDDAVFKNGSGDVLFSRDRSGLSDANGEGTPAALAADLSNLAAASAGDPLVVNASLLTGTTWRCPNEQPYPSYSTNYAVNASMPSTDSKTSSWADGSLDEGVYGIFRYAESWWQLDRSSTSQGAGRYIDFYVNGSVVAMFYSREARGKHILNQGYFPNMVDGCSGQDNNQQASRGCRLNPGFEYGWESSRRSIQFDPTNNTTGGMPPGVPTVISTDRLRWVRR